MMDIIDNLCHLDEDEDFLKGRRKARKAKRKAKKAKRKSMTKSEKKKRRKAIFKKAAGALLLQPLIPFKIAMKKALKSRGVDTKKMKFRDVITKFYNEFVSKKNVKTSNFEILPENFMEETGLWNISVSEYDEQDSVVGAAVETVVTAIITFFKNRKAKKAELEAEGKDPKKEMAPADLAAAAEAEKVTAELAAKAEEAEPVAQKDHKKLIIVVVAVVAIALIAFMMSKKK